MINVQWWPGWCVGSQGQESAAFHPDKLSLCTVGSTSRVPSSLHDQPSASPEPTTRRTTDKQDILIEISLRKAVIVKFVGSGINYLACEINKFFRKLIGKYTNL